MRYLGSKTLLLEQIFELISEYNNGSFCDPFGGIGTVGSFMKQNGFHVVTGDILNFAHCFQYTLIERDGDCFFEKLREHLNVNDISDIEDYLSNVFADEGWLIKEYSEKRLFFTNENACHVQGCINCIEKWYSENIIDVQEKKVLLASLINSLDKVANTAGTYYGYLKQFDRRARKKFKFSILRSNVGPKSFSYKMDAGQLVKRTKCDVLYLDPPYNERNYACYYHLPETISLGVIPEPKGKSGIFQANKVSSDYNSKNKAIDSFERLIQCADAKCILFHYTDSGLIDIGIAKEILSSKGTVVADYYFDSKGYNTSPSIMKNRHHILKVCI